MMSEAGIFILSDMPVHSISPYSSWRCLQQDIHASHESAEQGVESALPSSVSNLDIGRRWGFPPLHRLICLSPYKVAVIYSLPMA